MIRAGCIGTGGISGVHLRYLKGRDDVKIVALCDIKPENLKRRQDEYGGEGFAAYREMLKKVELDAVWLCTPPQVRGEPLVACADLGIPVFCEKPVERDPKRDDRVVAQLAKRNGKVQIGYVFRCMPTIERIRKEMADDKIHLVQSLYGCNMALSRAFPAWFYDKAISGGALVDQATHNLDVLRMLMGEVVEVSGVASNPVEKKHKGYTCDEVLAVGFRFKNGAVGSHNHTWVGDNWRNEILFSGEKRLYRLNLGDGSLTVEDGRETRRFQQDQGRMYEFENARFLEMVKSGDWSNNPSDYADGTKSLKLTLACDAAISGGKG